MRPGPGRPTSRLEQQGVYSSFKSDRHRLLALVSRDIRLALVAIALIVASSM